MREPNFGTSEAPSNGSCYIFSALARSTFVTSRAENDWMNKFLVTVHNSAYLKRPDPSTLALRVKGRQRQTSLPSGTKKDEHSPSVIII